MNVHDWTGKTVGHLTVLVRSGRKGSRLAWLCQCVCGKRKRVQTDMLAKGKTKSCGCRGKGSGKEREVHGGAGSVEYRAYNAAKNRCENPANKDFANYGGRGIEFRFASFKEFQDDLGKRPSTSHSIDRKENDGHYEKGNMRWTTLSEQLKNRRKGLTRASKLDQIYFKRTQRDLTIPSQAT